MIFVTIGNGWQFDRLIKIVDEAIKIIKYRDEVIYQLGPSNYKPRYGSLYKLLPKEQYYYYLKKSDFVITHGGEGIMMDCAKILKKPMVMPRLRIYNEAKNDHQMQLAKRFWDINLINIINSKEDVVTVIQKKDNSIEKRLLQNFPKHIGQEISDLLENISKEDN